MIKIKSVRLRFEPHRKPRLIFKPLSGKEISHSLLSDDRHNAQTVLTLIKNQIDLGTFDIERFFTNDNSIKTSALFSRWLRFRENEVRQGRLSPLTLNLDRLACKSFSAFSALPLININIRHIDDWINSLDLAGTTISIRKRSLTTLFNQAVKWNYLSKNPFAGYKHAKIPKIYEETDEPRYLSEAEICALRDYFSGRIDMWQIDAFNLAIWTGMRANGIFNCNVNNLKSEIIKGKQEHLLKVIEKGNKKRWIPLSENAYQLISRRSGYLSSGSFKEMIHSGVNTKIRDAQISRAGSGYIFFEISRAHSISQAFFRAKKALFPDARNMTFHSTRHTFAVRYLENGGQLHKLQTILGHASLETTRRIYGKDTIESITERIDELANI